MTSTYTDRLQGVTTSTAIKAPVVVATTANITLSGLQTIDGVSVAANDRVLVKDQGSATENGLWLASAGAWTRTLDFNDGRDVRRGTLVYVYSGTVGGGTLFEVLTADPVSIGSSAISFDAVAFGDGGGGGGGVSETRQINTGTGLTGGGDLSENRTLALTGQALALHSFSETGVVARTGASTFEGRSVTGGTFISVTNGDGVAGNPTVDLAESAIITSSDGIDANDVDTAIPTAAAVKAFVEGQAFGWTWLASVTVTSGTSATIASAIPDGVSDVSIRCRGISLTTADNWGIRLGNAGGIVSSGYLGGSGSFTTVDTFVTTLGVFAGNSARSLTGSISLTRVGTGNLWIGSGTLISTTGAIVVSTVTEVDITDPLTQIQVTCFGGAFDATGSGIFQVGYR